RGAAIPRRAGGGPRPATSPRARPTARRARDARPRTRRSAPGCGSSSPAPPARSGGRSGPRPRSSRPPPSGPCLLLAALGLHAVLRLESLLPLPEAALRDRRPREERDLGAFSDLSEFPEREASEFPEPTNARRRSVVKAAVANASVAIVAG